MILIFSNSIDYSTYEVMLWLQALGAKDVIRVNAGNIYSESLVLIHIAGEDFAFKIEDRIVHLKDIKAVWYRKGKNWLCDQFFSIDIEGHAPLSQYLNSKIKREETKLVEYVHYLIEQNIPSMGKSTLTDLNKLITLSVARSIGFLIPDYYISNHKKGVQEILSKHDTLISKSMSDGLYLFEKKENQLGYFSYTEKISAKDANDFPEVGAPSFLQKAITKSYEVRVFYMDRQCYAMAIFSQTNQQTKIDYRKYVQEKPNRFVPYWLPANIQQKVLLLFEKLDLDTGSIDFIVDTKGDFYFLEINPVGQFGMVSKPCNYALEKKVALKLLDYAQ